MWRNKYGCHFLKMVHRFMWCLFFIDSRLLKCSFSVSFFPFLLTCCLLNLYSHIQSAERVVCWWPECVRWLQKVSTLNPRSVFILTTLYCPGILNYLLMVYLWIIYTVLCYHMGLHCCRCILNVLKLLKMFVLCIRCLSFSPWFLCHYSSCNYFIANKHFRQCLVVCAQSPSWGWGQAEHWFHTSTVLLEDVVYDLGLELAHVSSCLTCFVYKILALW